MNITLTGLDQNFSDRRARQLLDFPDVELAILYSDRRMGENRYPSNERIKLLLQVLPKHRVALHVCGKKGRTDLFKGKLDPYLACLSRLQVNGELSVDEIEVLCVRYHPLPVITQWTSKSPAGVFVKAPNHQLLVDGSAGAGVLPETWTRPMVCKPLGWAGGLTPVNVAKQLPAIRSLYPHYQREHSFVPWVDVESGIRDEEDWMNWEKAIAFVKAVHSNSQ